MRSEDKMSDVETLEAYLLSDNLVEGAFMLKIKEIEKLKDDLSNSVNHCSIDIMEKLRNIHRKFGEETFEEFLERLLTTEEKEQIEKGYARIIDNIFYSSMPNYFQKFTFKELFDMEFKEV